MDAGLLFVQARRTAACQLALFRAAKPFGTAFAETGVCLRDTELSARIASLLKKNDAVFLICAAPDRRPACAEAIFRTLRVPLREDGEPEGILRLSGVRKTGYLVESVSQAILLLPDDPAEIRAMAPAAFARLAKKFGLSGGAPDGSSDL